MVPTAGDEHNPNHHAQENERDVSKLSQLRERHVLLYKRFGFLEGGIDECAEVGKRRLQSACVMQGCHIYLVAKPELGAKIDSAKLVAA